MCADTAQLPLNSLVKKFIDIFTGWLALLKLTSLPLAITNSFFFSFGLLQKMLISEDPTLIKCTYLYTVRGNCRKLVCIAQFCFSCRLSACFILLASLCFPAINCSIGLFECCSSQLVVYRETWTEVCWWNWPEPQGLNPHRPSGELPNSSHPPGTLTSLNLFIPVTCLLAQWLVCARRNWSCVCGCNTKPEKWSPKDMLELEAAEKDIG